MFKQDRTEKHSTSQCACRAAVCSVVCYVHRSSNHDHTHSVDCDRVLGVDGAVRRDPSTVVTVQTTHDNVHVFGFLAGGLNGRPETDFDQQWLQGRGIHCLLCVMLRSSYTISFMFDKLF